AVAVQPTAIIADEPTTALDVTTQSEVMAILDERRHADGLALLLITHDLDLASAVCDRTVGMDAGRVMEVGDSAAIHEAPRHPYTAALASSRPNMDSGGPRLATLKGQPLSAIDMTDRACPFLPRCVFAVADCGRREPPLDDFGGGLSACIRTDDVRAA